ncbi:MAG: hypothetical protein ACI9TZ_002657, partial [Yoonia sp.]
RLRVCTRSKKSYFADIASLKAVANSIFRNEGFG